MGSRYVHSLFPTATPHPDSAFFPSMPAQEQSGLTLIGWRERVTLPEWGIGPLRAKIDTGARTSAIHVENIEYLDDAGSVVGETGAGAGAARPVPPEARRVRFDVMLHRRNEDRRMTIEAELVRAASVRPSHGTAQQRPVVQTLLRLGGLERRIELSLVSRRGMLCRMLLGRRALEGLAIDPGAKYVLTGRRSRNRGGAKGNAEAGGGVRRKDVP